MPDDASNMNSKVVFLVEDHVRLRTIITDFINAMPQFRVLSSAASAEAALNTPDLFGADLLITDIGLPGMTGIDLIQEVITKGLTCRVIAYSAHTETSFIHRALSAGAHAYVVKDEFDRLHDAMKRVMAGGADIIIAGDKGAAH